MICTIIFYNQHNNVYRCMKVYWICAAWKASLLTLVWSFAYLLSKSVWKYKYSE